MLGLTFNREDRGSRFLRIVGKSHTTRPRIPGDSTLRQRRKNPNAYLVLAYV
jgi:hypothetical protein